MNDVTRTHASAKPGTHQPCGCGSPEPATQRCAYSNYDGCAHTRAAKRRARAWSTPFSSPIHTRFWEVDHACASSTALRPSRRRCNTPLFTACSTRAPNSLETQTLTGERRCRGATGSASMMTPLAKMLAVTTNGPVVRPSANPPSSPSRAPLLPLSSPTRNTP